MAFKLFQKNQMDKKIDELIVNSRLEGMLKEDKKALLSS